MARRPVDILRLVANVWLGLFYAWAALAFVDELLGWATGFEPLFLFRPMATLPLVVSTPLLWLAVLLTPRLPLGTFLPALLFLSWMVVGASPLSIVVYDHDAAGIAVAGAQACAALLVAGTVSLREGRPALWLTRATVAGRPAWNWPRFGGLLGAHVVLGPVLLAAYAWLSVDFGMRHLTANFIGLTREGVEVAHRTYRCGDGTVDLIGMIHLGDDRAYETLFDPLPVEGSLVLEEGVSDREGLLKGGTGYDRMAARLGIGVQRPIQELCEIEVRNADVDVSVFSKETLTLLDKVFALYRGDDTAAAALDYLRYTRQHPDERKMVRDLMHDIVDLRNDRLLQEIDTALDEGRRAVAPWGAYHLHGVQEALIGEWGCTEQSERWHTLIPFRALGSG